MTESCAECGEWLVWLFYGPLPWRVRSHGRSRDFNKKMFLLFRGEMVRGIARLSPLCAASLSLSAFFPWMCQLLPNNGSYGL